jgi:hypothetical protein
MSQFKPVEVSSDILRLINSRWPPIGLFDELADSEDELRLLFNLEMLTNARLNVPMGRLARIPEGGIVTGPTASQIMASFVHCHDDGGRFNDTRLGAWYGSFAVNTAIEETVYHLTKRLSLSEGGFPQQMQMRQLVTTVNKPLLDLTNSQNTHPQFYATDDYSGSQQFANQHRWPFATPLIKNAQAGVAYDSVRQSGGTNVCVFMPRALNRPVVQAGHYQYDWNAKGEIYVAKLTGVKMPPAK